MRGYFGQRRKLLPWTLGVLASSLALAVGLNSTIWSSPGNPLDLRTYLKSDFLAFGATQATSGLLATNGDYVFSRQKEELAEVASPSSEAELGYVVQTGVTQVVAFHNRGTAPIPFPEGTMCLKTNLRHLESPTVAILNISYSRNLVPNPGEDEWANEWVFPGQPGITGYFTIAKDEIAQEIYYGTCGTPDTAWFRFQVSSER